MIKESLNMKIYRDLYEKIKSHFYKPDEQLPTEFELENIYKTSKAPIRQALGKLEVDGLIIRKAGKGTFVASKIKKERTSFLGGFGAHFAKYREQTSYQMVEVKDVQPKARVAEKLKLPKSKKVCLISRLRLVNNQPIFLLNHYVPSLTASIFEHSGVIDNMREFLQKQGIEMDYITESIQAITVDKYLQPLFNLPIGSPLLKIYRTTFNKNYLPTVYEEYYVLSDQWTYDIQFNAHEDQL